MARPSEVEAQLRSAGRLATWSVIAFILFAVVLVWAGHPHHKPAPAPCPPAACELHPHAPHGPTP